MRLRVIAAVSLFAVVACVAGATERIRYTMPKGLEFRFDARVVLRLDVDVEAGGQKVRTEQVMTQITRGGVRVLESKGGVPTRAEIRFAPDCGTTTRFMNQTQPAPFALAGRTVLAIITPDGEVRVEPSDNGGPLGTVDEDTLLVVRGVMAPDPGFPPADAVGVGDAWTATLGYDDEPIRPTLTFRVEDFDEGEGRRFAALAGEGTISGEDEGVRLDGALSGRVLVDLWTGLQTSVRLSGPVTTDASFEQDGVPITLKGRGTMEVTGTTTFDDWDADAAGPSAPAAAAPPAADAGEGGWVRYRHATGTAFEHPAGWRVQEQPQGLVIIPSDHDASREMIIAFGSPAQGLEDAASPVTAQAIDTLIAQQAPMLRRVAAPEPIETRGGSGALYRYEGTAPDGRRGACAVFVRMGEGAALAFSVLGDPQRVEQRLPTLRRMAATLQGPQAGGPGLNPGGPGLNPGGAGGGAGGGAQTDDPRLIGMFAGEALAGGGDMYINTRLVYALGGDGVVHYGAQSAMNASQRDIHGNLIYTAGGVTDGSVQRGRWSAANGFVTLRWDSGETTVMAYGFEPDGTLALRDPQTRKLINIYQRVQ